jgi:predicted CopG family antitoxin
MARTIEISDETFEKLKTQLGEDCYKDITSLSDMVGEKFYFRTVTYHLTGRVKKVIGSILELENAAWIADSGRFMNAIKEGKLNEVEPVGRAYINIQSVTDFFPWKHELPSKQI